MGLAMSGRAHPLKENRWSTYPSAGSRQGRLLTESPAGNAIKMWTRSPTVIDNTDGMGEDQTEGVLHEDALNPDITAFVAWYSLVPRM